MKEISVVVCTLNSEKTIVECLKSIKENEPLEIILVDGHSQDRTVEKAKKYVDKILYDEGKSLAIARNVGLEAAKAKYVIFVGPDNVIPPGFLKKIKTYFVENNCSIISSLTLLKDTSSYMGWAQNLYRQKYTPGYKNSVGTPMFGLASLLKKYKFDPALKWSDDADLCERMAKDGHRFAISPVICYEIGSTNLKHVFHRWKMYGESDYLFYKKYAKDWNLKRKIKSFSHPLETEIITTFGKIGFLKSIPILPFLVFITLIRYYGWITGRK